MYVFSVPGRNGHAQKNEKNQRYKRKLGLASTLTIYPHAGRTYPGKNHSHDTTLF